MENENTAESPGPGSNAPAAGRGARTFAPLPAGVVRVRLEGQSAAGLAERLTALPGVTVVTGPDSYHPQCFRDRSELTSVGAREAKDEGRR